MYAKLCAFFRTNLYMLLCSACIVIVLADLFEMLFQPLMNPCYYRVQFGDFGVISYNNVSTIVLHSCGVLCTALKTLQAYTVVAH